MNIPSWKNISLFLWNIYHGDQGDPQRSFSMSGLDLHDVSIQMSGLSEVGCFLVSC